MTENHNLHFRELRSWPFHEVTVPTDFRVFVERHVWPRLEVSGRRSTLERRKELAIQMVHALVSTGLAGGVVADPRSNDRAGARSKVELWEALIGCGFARKCTGSETSGRVTRYRATGHLLDLYELLCVDVIAPQPGDDCPIIVHTGKIDPHTGQPLKEEEQRRRLTLTEAVRRMAAILCKGDLTNEIKVYASVMEKLYRGLGRQIDLINKGNLCHGWVTRTEEKDDPEQAGNRWARPVDPRLRIVGAGMLPIGGGRLYTWGPVGGQSLSKRQRRELLIDGESAAEFDSVSHHIRLLYHASKLSADGDLYRPEVILKRFWSWENVSDRHRKIARDFIKKATNIALNTSCRKVATRAVSLVLREDGNLDRDLLNRVLFKVEGINVNGLLTRIEQAHPHVSGYFFASMPTVPKGCLGIEGFEVLSLNWQNIGSFLMDLDGRIMWRAMVNLHARNIPVLAIHDSVVVKAGQVTDAQEIYAAAYHAETGYYPALRREF